MLDSCCELFEHILVPVVLHYSFAECEVRASRKIFKRRRPLVRIVVLEVLDNLEVGVHRHVLLQVVLVAAETLGTQHVLWNAVYHHREPVVDTPVLDLLRRLFPLRYLGRELVLVKVYIPLFAARPLRQPALNDDFLPRLLLLRLFVDCVFINFVLFHFFTLLPSNENTRIFHFAVNNRRGVVPFVAASVVEFADNLERLRVVVHQI